MAVTESIDLIQKIGAKVVEFPAPARVKNPAAVALGKLGGSKGGKIRAANLSSEERRAIAQQAAKARWAKVRSESEMIGSQPPSKT
jgi:hypothetical protein